MGGTVPNIDVHTHIVPHNLPNDSGRSEAWPSIELRGGDNAAVMVRGKVFRAIDSRSWNVARRLDDMGADGIDVQVLSPMPELLSHWLPVDEADDLSKIMNEQAARMIAAAPGNSTSMSREARTIETLAINTWEVQPSSTLTRRLSQRPSISPIR